MGTDTVSVIDSLTSDDFGANPPSYEDFESYRVFEYILNRPTRLEQMDAFRRMTDRAREVKYKRFTQMFQLYKAERTKTIEVAVQRNELEFGEQESALPSLNGERLSCGEWIAEETGVYKIGDSRNMVVACSHPIVPVRRLVSIDTKEVKYTLAYRRGNQDSKKPWRYVDIDAADMASPTEIVKKLAPKGVSVSGGDRAKALVDYLRDVADLNYSVIPEVRSVSRLGWNEDGFAPYNDGIVFDGAQAFNSAFKALSPKGDFDAWREELIRCRADSVTSRIVIAASFAAPLIEKLGILPFFIHLWSVESGTGKTVAQMLGASVWGDPNPGGAFFPTFRSTSVGLELIAGFLHSMPVFLDELQLAKDSHGNVNFNVYELASGSGKLRGNKQLGLNYTPTWATTFITSGETPIVKETDGEGALNRVFEIECHAGQKVVEDGHKTANLLKSNYGHAGKLFVEKLMEDGSEDYAKELYEKFYSECVKSDTTEKQAMAASAILVADQLATEWIFHDYNALGLNDISEFLKTKERVSLLDRGYDLICDWVTVNAGKLQGQKDGTAECYGILEKQTNTAYIIRSVFRRICDENGLSEKGMLSHLRSRGKLRLSDDKRYTKLHYLGNDTRAQCVGLILPSESDDGMSDFPILGDDEALPF